MKKFLKISLLFACFLLVGCGKENTTNEETKNEVKKEEVVLDCSKKTEGTIDFVTDMIYYFENDNPVKLGIKYTYDLSKYNEEQRKIFADSKMCESESMKNTVGITECKEQLEDTNYIVTGFSEKLLNQAKDNFENTKKSYESAGWNCVKNNKWAD